MLKWKGNAFLNEIEEVKNDVTQECIDIIAALADENVPVVTGKLKESQVREVDETGGAIGYSAPYAIDVHENPDSRGYKFLERAVQDSIGRMQIALRGMREKVK